MLIVIARTTKTHLGRQGVFTDKDVKALSHEGMIRVRTDLVRALGMLAFKDSATILKPEDRKEWLRTHSSIYVDAGNARYMS